VNLILGKDGEMNIKPEIIKSLLDSFAEKQEEDNRFIPVIIKTELTEKGTVKVEITSEEEMIEPLNAEINIGDTLSLKGCYYLIRFSNLM